MFNFGDETSELIILGLFGFGLYAQNNDLNLANNTTILLLLLFLLLGHSEIKALRQEFCCAQLHHDDDHDHEHGHCGYERPPNNDFIEIRRGGRRCCPTRF